MRGFDLGALLDELAQFFGRERPALSALGLLARDVHLHVLIGLAAAVALLAVFAFAGGLRFRALHSFDQVVAHPLGFFFGERIAFAALARLPNQLLEPIVERADLADAGHHVGAALANRREVMRRHLHERRFERFAGRVEIERRAHQHRAERLGMEPLEQRAIEAGDARRESAIAPREFGVDARRLASRISAPARPGSSNDATKLSIASTPVSPRSSKPGDVGELAA